jgi:predicted transcriptional regulator
MDVRSIKEMVERVRWMSPIDYEILLFFEDHEILVSPKVLGANIEYDRQYTSKRCRKLTQEGILEQDGESGLYGLSDRGRRFLAGELDAEEFERDEE